MKTHDFFYTMLFLYESEHATKPIAPVNRVF